MTGKEIVKLPQVIQATVLSPHPTPRLKLAKVRDCRRELAKLYAEARNGEIEPADATRLAYILTQLATMIRETELEQRIETLENRCKAL